MKSFKDTIFALSTASGKSAIAVVRVSGPNAEKTLKKISTRRIFKQNISYKNTILDKKNKEIDSTITVFYKSPKSYTGEDMFEISLHGSQAVIEKTLNRLGEFKNHRMAGPGEFTKRAFENNKLDLTQVEAIADLISAETEEQRKQAINHLNGAMSKKINKWAKNIKKILANLEAAIDFVEEEIPKNLIESTKEQIENLINEIYKFLDDDGVGEKIRSGFIVSIIGSPNSGKSSFINNIAKRDISIVTNMPGTTRDVIELYTDFLGFPVKFYDTAGIRNSKNLIEQIGIKKTLTLSSVSDVNLVFINKLSEIKEYKNIKNKIIIKSKNDIYKGKYKNINHSISSKTGKGVSKMLKSISTKIIRKGLGHNEGVSRERHRIILKKTLYHLEKSKNSVNIDIFAEEIRLSLREVSKITGKVDIEEILGIIFNDFCIGK